VISLVTIKTIGKLEKDIEKIKINVKEYIKQKQELFYAEIKKDRPNDERVDKYEEQLEILRGVLDHLEECCDELEEYE
jgi:hypothetical protein